VTNLSGKTALVTGASRGIGRASALALAKAGAQVLVHYSSSQKEAEAVVAEIRKAGGRAEKVAADLRAPNGPHALAKLVHGIVGARLDILVANAGIAKAASIEDTTVEDFDALFAVNVRAPYFLVQQLLPAMCKGSSIVFVSSLAARASVEFTGKAVSTLSAYAATKGALDTLVTHFASALGGRGIRVNAVAPGVVETDMSSFARTDVGRGLTLAIQALKRVAQPDDVGGVVAFLASDEARWITGDTVRVDGGSKL
jgi:NAD(P)-dependent dehydrogenase (short-subunit alcohol dehydrogenase family)